MVCMTLVKMIYVKQGFCVLTDRQIPKTTGSCTSRGVNQGHQSVQTAVNTDTSDHPLAQTDLSDGTTTIEFLHHEGSLSFSPRHACCWLLVGSRRCGQQRTVFAW